MTSLFRSLRIVRVSAWLASALLGVALVPARALTDGAAESWSDKVDASVLQATELGDADFLVVLRDQADVRGTRFLQLKQDRGRWVYETLSALAQRTQVDLLATLRELGVEHRSFWIANMVYVRGDHAVVERLARDERVAQLVADAPLRRAAPQRVNGPRVDGAQGGGTATVARTEWNIAKIGAPAVWAKGITGQGAVVGGMDTGYAWEHPTLVSQYRGWNQGIALHDYNWHDAIHAKGPLHCPPDSPEPCDGDFSGHGTHTMGTAVGDDGAGHQIGVAPGAQWIGCRCWEAEFRTRLSYVTECFEWFVAPTDIQGSNPNPAMAPHVITNSWVCDPGEGCADPNVLRQVVENVRAAGIVVAAGAGNDGPGCTTVFYPPAIYAASFSVGATDHIDRIAGFSSRGPVLVDGSNRMKPDISAPGLGVRSAVPGNGFATYSGTSMATPHISGAVALLVSAVPELAGQVDEIEDILLSTAVPLTTADACGDELPGLVPNNTFGVGRLDVFAAYQEALSRMTAIGDELPHTAPDTDGGLRPAHARLLENRPNPFNPGTRLGFVVGVTSAVTLDIHDISGRRVRRLLSHLRAPGAYTAVWDGRDQRGLEAPSGIYVVRFTAGRVQQSRRIVLVR